MPFQDTSINGLKLQSPKGAFATGTFQTEATWVKDVLLFHLVFLLVFAIPLQFELPTAVEPLASIFSDVPEVIIVRLE
jgi:hypothetical protein